MVSCASDRQSSKKHTLSTMIHQPSASYCSFSQYLLLVLFLVVCLDVIDGDVYVGRDSEDSSDVDRIAKTSQRHIENHYFPQSDMGAIDNRELQETFNEESDHYFCGMGFADASSSCEHPCPTGSLEE